jgi:hypothetical protein
MSIDTGVTEMRRAQCVASQGVSPRWGAATTEIFAKASCALLLACSLAMTLLPSQQIFYCAINLLSSVGHEIEEARAQDSS